jgi:hypothetical protein
MILDALISIFLAICMIVLALSAAWWGDED